MLKIAKKLLEEVSTKLGRVLNGNNTALPILDSVKIDVNEQCVIFTASNGIDSTVVNLKLANYEEEIIVERPFTICLPKKSFSTISKLKNGMVEIIVEESSTQVLFKQNKTQLAFPLFDVQEYPSITPQGKPLVHFTMNYGIFSEIVNNTTFAAATSDSRPALTGVNLVVQNQQNGVTFEASCTDAHRLGRVTSISKIDDSQPKHQVIIPAVTLVGILKSFDKSDVGVAVYQNTVAFVNANVIAFTRLIEGNYPDVNKIIPTANEHIVKLPTMEVIESLELIKALKESRDAIFTFTAENVTVTSRVGLGSGSKAVQEINLIDTTTAEYAIGLNIDYMLNALKTVKTDNVRFEMSGALRPVLVYPENTSEDILTVDVTQLVLPIRVI